MIGRKKTNEQTLKEALGEMLQSFHLDEKFQQQKLIISWEKIMGKVIANRTNRIFFSQKKLFIYLDSASLREELLNAREKIKKLLNDEAGKTVIEEIVFQ